MNRLTAEHLRDPQYWRKIAPQLTPGRLTADKANSPVGEINFTDAQLMAISDQFHSEGILQLAPVFSAAEMRALKQAILSLEEEGLPPVFIYAYDEPWQLFNRLSPLIEYFLGANFRLLPNFWAWHIPATAGAAGWPPHRDCQAETRLDDGDGGEILMSLSLWIPLVDVSEDNSCMYVLPHRSGRHFPTSLRGPDDFDQSEGRALPAKAGSVLGWPQDVYHWSGTMSPQASAPRLSLSLEFQNAAFAPLAEPLLDVCAPPGLETRLTLIGKQFAKYRHMETSCFDLSPLEA